MRSQLAIVIIEFIEQQLARVNAVVFVIDARLLHHIEPLYRIQCLCKSEVYDLSFCEDLCVQSFSPPVVHSSYNFYIQICFHDKCRKHKSIFEITTTKLLQPNELNIPVLLVILHEETHELVEAKTPTFV
jgi:hypothetical protein